MRELLYTPRGDSCVSFLLLPVFSSIAGGFGSLLSGVLAVIYSDKSSAKPVREKAKICIFLYIPRYFGGVLSQHGGFVGFVGSFQGPLFPMLAKSLSAHSLPVHMPVHWMDYITGAGPAACGFLFSYLAQMTGLY